MKPQKSPVSFLNSFPIHFTVLCLPFYAAAFAGGVPINAILLVLVLSLFLHPEVRIAIALMGWLFWFLLSFAIHQQMGLPLSILLFWRNVPFLLQQPIGIGDLRTPKGYEEWLRRTEELARKRSRIG
ncbi:MAG: hypothetical protein N3B10_12335 [Armatimonadetes bacterium]|nr:hypothetical protein [Armatimonadota bacterium]